MNLYMIQDAEGPLWVIAETWQRALEKWRDRMIIDNGPGDYDPMGISRVCDGEELIL